MSENKHMALLCNCIDGKLMALLCNCIAGCKMNSADISLMDENQVYEHYFYILKEQIKCQNFQIFTTY